MIAKKGAGGAGLGENLTKIAVAGLVLNVKEDGAGEGGGPVGCGSDLGSQDGMDPSLPSGEEKIDSGMEVGVGQANGRQTQFCCPGHDLPDREKGVMKAVVRPDIERSIGKHFVIHLYNQPLEGTASSIWIGGVGD